MFWISPLHLPHSSPVTSSTPVPAPVITPTFSTVSAPFLTAFTTVSKETFLHPHTEVSIESNSFLHPSHSVQTPADLTISSALIVNHEIDKYGLVKRFEYSREQEVEADLTALMFLEWLERDPTSYIELMRKMPQGDGDDDSEEYRTHPTMDFRIKSMKDFIGMPDRVFEVDNLNYTVLGWHADEFVAKHPDAVEISKNNRKAVKRASANRNVEFDDVYQ